MKDSPYTSTTNACKLCAPLGAALVYKGIEGCIPFLHGSQGCATYMRRYIISHFREPVDIASSALGEKHAVFGGGPNLKKGLINVMQKYGAGCVGIASTCLTETIGDDVPMILKEFVSEFKDLDLPPLVHASTPSYAGTHMEGWHAACRSIVQQLVEPAGSNGSSSSTQHTINVLPGLVATSDMRHLKDICLDFGLTPVLLPDLCDTLDGPALEDYERIPSGGTPLASIRSMSSARATLELGATVPAIASAGQSLANKHAVPLKSLPMPVGLRQSDALFQALTDITGQDTPERYAAQRGRLVDAYVDGHKYLSGIRAVVYGEEDLVAGLVGFLAEIGVRPVLAATGGKNPGFRAALAEACEDLCEVPAAVQGVDFQDISEQAEELSPDILIGHSKGYSYAKKWNIPLLRVGFPIHDRFGGQRIRTLGYQGAQMLFDRLVNTILEKRQADNPIGYGYL